jgi:hypothetical protein
MINYKKLYKELLEAEELPEHFTGNWEEDRKEFIDVHELLENIIQKQNYDLLDEEEEQEYFD